MVVRFVIVTQTFPPVRGGMQSVMGALANRLSEYAPVCVYPDRAFCGEGYQVRYWPVAKPLRAWVKRMRLSLYLREDDVVLCDSWKSLQALPSSFSGRVVVLAHGQEYLTTSFAKRERIRALLRRADHVVASSRATAALVQDVMLPQPIALTVIAPTYSVDGEVIARHSAVDHVCRLVSVCRLEERKGLGHVLHALAQLPQQLEYEWLIVGGGEDASRLKRTIERLGLASRVRLLGFVSDDEKDRLLKAADLFVMPSYQVGDSLEGFGIVYVEAARYAVPSIAGVDGGVVDAVADRVTGWCVSPQSTDALKAVLLEALTEQSQRELFGRNAQHAYKEQFHGDVVMAKLLHVLGVTEKEECRA